jgi:hypothetical protein
MQGVGRADVLLYFKCPTTKQMQCPVNVYRISVQPQASVVLQPRPFISFFFIEMRHAG